MRSSLFTALSLVALLGMSCGRSATSPEAEKDDGSGTSSADEDKPDQSAPVSGAYLTCLAPEPTAEMDYMVAGCQLRDGLHRHVAEKDPETRWAFAPAEGKTGPSIEVYDLYDKPQHYFDAMFVMRFPKGSGLQEFNRLAAVDYFLTSVPVLAPKSILLSSVKKTESSLALLGAGSDEPDPAPSPTKPEPMTFRRHNTAVDTEKTIPADAVSGIRARPYVIPQVIEVNKLPVLPQIAAGAAQPVTQAALPPAQAQNPLLNPAMMTTLLGGLSNAIAAGSAAQPAQQGVVSGPPPAQSGGCTCQN